MRLTQFTGKITNILSDYLTIVEPPILDQESSIISYKNFLIKEEINSIVSLEKTIEKELGVSCNVETYYKNGILIKIEVCF